MQAEPLTIRLIRRVFFSSGHRYWLPSLTADQNKQLFGRWASPYNHGHNYSLEVETEGQIDPKHGMVINIKDIDRVLQQKIVAQFDQKSLNDEVEAFRQRPSSLENLLSYIEGELKSLPKQVKLSRLRLEETSKLYGELNVNEKNVSKRITLTRIYEFAASHRLHVPTMSPSENLELFGKCNNPAGHGHNYILEVTVSGQPDAETGMLVDLEELDTIVNKQIIDRYDHKNLSEDLPEFAGINATSEVVVAKIFETLRQNLPARLERVRLQETARNIFEVSASD